MLTTFLGSIVAPVFYKLLFMSITALVVGMIIILIRRFADKRFSPFWKYTMWVLVLIALILPWRMQSDFALMNTTEKLQDVSFSAEYTQAQTEYETIKQNNLGYSSAKPLSSEIEAKSKMESLHVKTLIFDNILPAIWLSGVIIIGMFMLYSGLRLSRKIKKSTIPIDTQRYENIMQNCKKKLGINRRVEIVLQSFVKTPALFGLIKPKIILPTYVENLNDEHLEYVILHELSHLKRLDGIVNTFLLTLQTVYWFNPLTWLLFKFIREDMELANDASVLKIMSITEQKEYSLSLVEVLAQYGKPSLAPRLLCMVDSEKNMERRINMIKLGEFFKRRKLVTAIAALLVIAITATLFLTVGATPKQFNINVNVSSALNTAISDAVFSHNKGGYGNQEAQAEGHVVLGEKTENNNQIIFAIATYGEYGFINDDFVKKGGTGSIPVKITFAISSSGAYILKDYQEPVDGEGNYASLKKMFPANLVNAASEPSQKNTDSMKLQEKVYADKYLKSIGRTAEVGDYIDFNFKLPTMNVQASNMLGNLFADFPMYVASEEYLKDGVRYVNLTAWQDEGNGNGVVTYKRYEYDSKKVLLCYIINVNNGNISYSNNSPNKDRDLTSKEKPQFDTSSAVTSQTPSNISDDSQWKDIEITGTTINITSAQVKTIKAGQTYREIFDTLPQTANFGHRGLRQYLVDNEKILVLKCSNLDDVCKLSGDELLKTAKSYKYPFGEIPHEKGTTTVYGIVIDDNFISCYGEKNGDCYSLNLNKASITFRDGRKASISDIKQMSGLLVSFDMSLSIYPPQAQCTKIVIVN